MLPYPPPPNARCLALPPGRRPGAVVWSCLPADTRSPRRPSLPAQSTFCTEESGFLSCNVFTIILFCVITLCMHNYGPSMLLCTRGRSDERELSRAGDRVPAGPRWHGSPSAPAPLSVHFHWPKSFSVTQDEQSVHAEQNQPRPLGECKNSSKNQRRNMWAPSLESIQETIFCCTTCLSLDGSPTPPCSTVCMQCATVRKGGCCDTSNHD